MKTYAEMADTVLSRLTAPDALTQLAEEAAELAHAGLKLARIIGGRNYTPVTYDEAVEALCEEVADVNVSVDMALCKLKLDYNRVSDVESEKLARWAARVSGDHV